MFRARLCDSSNAESMVNNIKFAPLARRFFKLDLYVKDLDGEIVKQLVGIEGTFLRKWQNSKALI